MWGAAEDSVAVANLTDAAAESGWAHLDIVTSEAQPDEEQAMAAGIAEGYLTSDAIYGLELLDFDNNTVMNTQYSENVNLFKCV